MLNMLYLTGPYLASFFCPTFFARPLRKNFKDFARPLGPKCKFIAVVSEKIKQMLMIFWPRTLILFHDKII